MRKRTLSTVAAKSPTLPAGYADIRSGIVELLDAARHAAARSVNALMTASYWEIGRRIVEAEQKGKRRAGYGEQLITRLSRDLTVQFGRGFSGSVGDVLRTAGDAARSPYRAYHQIRGAFPAPRYTHRVLSALRRHESWAGCALHHLFAQNVGRGCRTVELEGAALLSDLCGGGLHAIDPLLLRSTSAKTRGKDRTQDKVTFHSRLL